MNGAASEGGIAALGAVVLVTAISWSLAHLARRLPDRIPRWIKVVVCGTLVQGVLMTLGYVFLVEEDFLEWVTSRPTRTYFLVPGIFLVGCLAAWSVLRDRKPRLDVGVFE